MYQSKVLGKAISPDDINQLGGKALLDLFNELTGLKVNKFADTKTGRKRTLRALEQFGGDDVMEVVPEPQVIATKKSVPAPAKAAEAPKPKDPPTEKAPKVRTLMVLKMKEDCGSKIHKPNTNRGKVIALGSRENGASMKELEEATGWSAQQIRSCLHQVNEYSGHGVEERENGRFYLTGESRSRKPFYREPGAEVKNHRTGTKRASVLEMMRSPGGATFEGVKDKCQWNDIQAYEGIMLIGSYLGYGILEDENGSIRAFTKAEWK